MNACRRTEEKIQSYLEDLLPETERSDIRKHLLHCPECAVFLKQIGSFTGDLRHTVFAPLPDQQMEALLLEMEKRESFSWSSAAAFIKFFLMLVLALCIFWIVLKGVGAASRYVQAEREKELQSRAAGSLIIQELKSIDKRLSRHSAKSINEHENAAAHDVPKNVVSLRPFHWHLDFESGAARDRYLEKLRALKSKFLYMSKETPVIELPYQDFIKLAETTPDFSGVLTKGKLVDIEHLPVPEKPVQVSFYFRYPDRAHKPHHWHLKFSLPNRFVFESEAKREFDFLFTQADLWVLNVNADEFVHFIQLVQKTQGLEADWGEEGQNPSKSRVRVPVMVIFSEA